MKSFLSVLMALVMAFACIGGVFAEGTGTLNIEAEVHIDKDALLSLPGTTEENKQQIALAADLLNVLKANLLTDGKVFQISLKAEDDALLDIGLKADGQGITLSSSLLGSKVIYLSAEVMKQLMQAGQAGQSAQIPGGFNVQEITEVIKGLDKEQIAKDVSECVQDFSAKIQAKVGEPETGSYEVDGMVFTTKVPVNLTFDELMEMVITFAKNIVTKDSLSPLMKVLAKDKDVGAALDKKIEEIKNMPAEEKFDMNIAVYSNETGDTYLAADVSRKAKAEGEKDEVFHLGLGTVGGKTIGLYTGDNPGGTQNFYFEATAEKNVNMEGTFDAKDSNVHMLVHAGPGISDSVVTVKASDATVMAHSNVQIQDGEGGFVYEWYYNDLEKAVITVNGKVSKGSEITSKFEGEGITVIPFEKLFDQKDTSTMSSLAMELSGQIMTAMNTLIKHLPEDTAKMLTQMMIPAQQ